MALNYLAGGGADFVSSAGTTVMVEDTALSPGLNFALFTAVEVPAPATLALLCAGLVGLGFARRRR